MDKLDNMKKMDAMNKLDTADVMDTADMTDMTDMIDVLIIVEGKNDRKRLSRLLSPHIEIQCTYGTLNTERIEALRKIAGDRHVYLFMDNDASGGRIRGMLADVFPEADHIYTRRGYQGVEGTPEEYLIQQLEKAGLEEFIVYPTPDF